MVAACALYVTAFAEMSAWSLCALAALNTVQCEAVKRSIVGLIESPAAEAAP